MDGSFLPMLLRQRRYREAHTHSTAIQAHHTNGLLNMAVPGCSVSFPAFPASFPARFFPLPT